MAHIVNNSDTLPIVDVEIIYTNKEDLHFLCVMWTDDLEVVQTRLTALKDRRSPNFEIIPMFNGGKITVDLSEVLSITSNPHFDDEKTTIEVDYIDDED